jgi:hypothetical protein
MRASSVLASVAVLVALGAPGGAVAAVPHSFFGVMADGPLLGGAVDLGAQTAAMRETGVGSMRVAVYWSDAQPYASATAVPADQRARFVDAEGVPTDFTTIDAVVAASAAAGLDVLPVVLRTPAWAAADPRQGASSPRTPVPYARFLTALVHRYGPGGAFWAGRPDLSPRPIRRWQVWNEPDIRKYWSRQPFAASYVRLLRAAHRAIHAADPGARVLLAGLTNRSWIDLRRVYEAGGRGAFDIAAAHPFSRRLANVVKIVALVRREMRRHGDRRTPLALTELSWSSGAGHSKLNYGWETTEQGQAQRIRAALPRLAALRGPLRLDVVYWYTWLSRPIGGRDSFDYSGLRRLDPNGAIVDKPALAAFRATVRGLTG